MSTLRSVVRALLGLFVDDGALAFEIVAVVVLTGVFAILIPGSPLVAGSILLLGCLGVLFANVTTAARRR